MTFHFQDQPDRMKPHQLLSYVDSLEAALRDFMTDAEPAAALRRSFGLTPAQARILAALSHGGMRTHEFLRASMYDGPKDSDIHIIKVQMCHLRRKLKGRGVVIECIWGTGYQITEGAEVIRATMAGAN